MAQMVDAASRAWVVMAAYNEGAVIGGVVRQVIDAGFRVVVVDDGSRDETAARARESGAPVVRHPINRGQGAAIQSGLQYALNQGAAILVTFDADGQHSVGDIPRLVEPIATDRADIVLGSRFLEHAASVPVARRLLLRMAILFTAMMSGVRLSDTHNGLRAMSRQAAESIDLHLDGMAHASEIIDQLVATKLRIIELPVHIHYTSYSVDKGQRAGNAARIVWDYLFSKWSG